MPTVPLLTSVPEGFAFHTPSASDPNSIVNASVVRRDCAPLDGDARAAVADAIAGNSWALARWGPNLRKRLYANFGIPTYRDPSTDEFGQTMRDLARSAAVQARALASGFTSTRTVADRECVRAVLSGEFHRT